jgi:hypothetical protein
MGELVEHGVEHLLVGHEVVVSAVGPQPQLHLDAPVDVEPQQPGVLRPDTTTDNHARRNRTRESGMRIR